MPVISLVNRKGGAGKSSLSVGLAAAYNDQGKTVAVIDTDPNRSTASWLDHVAEIESIACSITNLAQLAQRAKDHYDIVIVDTPPNDEHSIIVASSVANLVVIPLAPSPLEVAQLSSTVNLIPPSTPWVVVPVRVQINTTAGRSIGDLIRSHELPVTTAIVPQRQAIMQAYGGPMPVTPFKALARELTRHIKKATT